MDSDSGMIIARLDGDSDPRSHRGKERFPPMTIICVSIQIVEKTSEKPDETNIITKERVKDLIIADGACTGCLYEKYGADFKEVGPVKQ